MINPNSKIIAVDFDGTIVEDEYPSIGKPKMFAFETLKMLQKDGHRLILWTYRTGRALQEAVEFCAEKEVEFYAVNASFPGEQFSEKEASRKINADVFIDDRNIGGMKGWGEIYQLISGEEADLPKPKKRKKRLFRF